MDWMVDMDRMHEDAQSLSALLDNELEPHALERALDAVGRDGLAAWQSYVWIRAALTQPRQVCGAGDAGFVAAVRQRMLQADSDVVSQSDMRPVAEPQAQPLQLDPRRLPAAANQDVVRWRALALAASAAAMAAVAWALLAGGTAGSAGAELAQAPAGGAPAPHTMAAGAGAMASQRTPVGTMVRDPRLDEMLAAHRQAQGPSALQAPTGFLRNATWEESGR